MYGVRYRPRPLLIMIIAFNIMFNTLRPMIIPPTALNASCPKPEIMTVAEFRVRQVTIKSFWVFSNSAFAFALAAALVQVWTQRGERVSLTLVMVALLCMSISSKFSMVAFHNLLRLKSCKIPIAMDDDGAFERRKVQRRLIVRFAVAVTLVLFTGVYKRAAGFNGSDPNLGTENEHDAFYWASMFNKAAQIYSLAATIHTLPTTLMLALVMRCRIYCNCDTQILMSFVCLTISLSLMAYLRWWMN
ncbi:hypothetical protein ISN45_Aa01g014400 [Arabidopsis thaliana x Arabidopsis arenosa]|uniref:Uncharacterized protein n=1 Tax=Arabidopsis thaliana x Arabidopsis arenosa TaxID=1240361 RepID=A0A8T2C0V4_9BRAS|nr:hypothetical protein ISN45_Aa01g014400 [Arabidopsis thaliana x Arabidopsis arenosa]